MNLKLIIFTKITRYLNTVLSGAMNFVFNHNLAWPFSNIAIISQEDK